MDLLMMRNDEETKNPLGLHQDLNSCWVSIY
jgi:hypothetical protein